MPTMSAGPATAEDSQEAWVCSLLSLWFYQGKSRPRSYPFTDFPTGMLEKSILRKVVLGSLTPPLLSARSTTELIYPTSVAQVTDSVFSAFR